MNLYETAKRWVIGLLAEVLNVSVSVVEAILPGQPRWLAQIRALEAQLRAAGMAGNDDRAKAGKSPGKGPRAKGGNSPGGQAAEQADLSKGAAEDLRVLLKSYTCLREALQEIEARGLSLDDGLMKRMAEDWTTESILGYLRAADEQIRKLAGSALGRAALRITGTPLAGEGEEAAGKTSSSAGTKPQQRAAS